MRIKNKKGFTLIEALIASSIFAFVAVMGATVFLNISRSERQTGLANAIYEDARIVIEKISNEIREGTIDYEEYYSIEVLDATHYGINRGVYGSRFFDPGMTYDDLGATGADGVNPDNLGAECFTAVMGPTVSCNDAAAKFAYPPSVDTNTGQNPYTGDAKDASAFCDDKVAGEECEDDPIDGPVKEHDELYLISKDGREKIIISRQKTTDVDYAISVLPMRGVDIDANGVIDVFSCTDDLYDYCDPPGCDPPGVADYIRPATITPTDLLSNNIHLPASNSDDIEFVSASSPFTPISPFRSTITELKFIIWPDEDPYKSFSEIDKQYQPNVTIILSIQPSLAAMEDYPGETPPVVKLQTTVSAGSRNEIQTYPPTKDVSWIK
ncbi:type II secretion system protein [Candidatus Peregrinibacteria bacterium]|nr:type II secretion system protein [Candidatus Peregrinibacteria bacterium]MBT4148727.1 type II secretion system protein [Candidatus Peregrinibacteria bacterium]MBT4366218.1 type II secretion system protein [Candidatus Peregrinibacteria bacterium]MBT4456274.1 type II secretion system protein [Candidatus Peregrinibacteria bacterium]